MHIVTLLHYLGKRNIVRFRRTA